MGTYYVDPAAPGSDTGADWTNAWSTLQRAIDGTNGTKPVAGDLILCRGVQNVTAVTDSDGNAGDKTSGHVIFRGVNASGVNDGTRYIMNAGGNSIDILRLSANYIKYENFEFYNTSKTFGNDGVVINGYTNLTGNSLINCIFRDTYNGVSGGSSSVKDLALIKCKAYNNANADISILSFNILFFSFCKFYGSPYGIKVQFGDTVIIHESIIIDHATAGIATATNQDFIALLNVVLHGNGDGIESKSDNTYLIGTRTTDNTVGIDSDSIVTLAAANYMPDTGEDLANTTKTTGLVDEIVLDGTNTNDLSGTDTDGGYEDSSTDDYNLTDTASLRRVEIDIDG